MVKYGLNRQQWQQTNNHKKILQKPTNTKTNKKHEFLLFVQPTCVSAITPIAKINSTFVGHCPVNTTTFHSCDHKTEHNNLTNYNFPYLNIYTKIQSQS